MRGIEKMDYDEAFRILADKNRMKIMQLLCGEQAYGLELAEKLKLSPNTISHHMSKLQKCGLVISSFEGNRVYYRANKAAVDEFIRMLSKKLRVK
jgi:DNA-binding transcriptional ArsR family regulator